MSDTNEKQIKTVIFDRDDESKSLNMDYIIKILKKCGVYRCQCKLWCVGTNIGVDIDYADASCSVLDIEPAYIKMFHELKASGHVS